MAHFVAAFSLFSAVRCNSFTRLSLEQSTDAHQPGSFCRYRLKNLQRIVVLLLLVWAFAQIGFTQAATGLPPFGSFALGEIDAVNLANGNVHIQIPLVHKAGRGIPFDYLWSNDSTVWTPYRGEVGRRPELGMAQYQRNSPRVRYLQDYDDLVQQHRLHRLDVR